MKYLKLSRIIIVSDNIVQAKTSLLVKMHIECRVVKILPLDRFCITVPSKEKSFQAETALGFLDRGKSSNCCSISVSL